MFSFSSSFSVEFTVAADGMWLKAATVYGSYGDGTVVSGEFSMLLPGLM